MLQKNYEQWLGLVKDAELKKELDMIKGDKKQIEDKFYKHLEFGTGGLRGVLGVGTNCLNIHTIEKATRGLANYVNSKKGKSVAISCDSRINSRLFAEVSACVLASCGIKVFLTKDVMPTPYVSYITRELKCDNGIMITASHNPKKYNGYKVYGSDGCQITDNDANMIIGEIGKVEYFTQKYDSLQSYIKNGLVEYTSDELETQYLEYIKTCSINKINDLSVTYTPLNGAGYKVVPRILKEIGIKKLDIVKEQGLPDGNFPTCEYPNPEKKEALALGLVEAKKNNSDLLLATDPDADRVGIAVKNNDNYKLITGNEVGALLCEYILSQKIANKTLPKNPVVVKTIVTTMLADKICKDYKVELRNVLTGFKYIGEQIGLLEKDGEQDRYVLGFEESYGYLVGTKVRDKDAVVASSLICEMTAYYKSNGKTLVNVLDELYAKYGTYQNETFSYMFEGASGSAKIAGLMKDLREKPLTEVCGYKVVESKDYNKDNGDGLPKANVISVQLDNEMQLIFRPSGTEPLIKTYLTVNKTVEENKVLIEKVTEFLNKRFA